MLVTNTTAHTFLLNTASPSVVVVIEPNAVDQLVSDTLYLHDSVFNQRFDDLLASGAITVTGQPIDPSPSGGVGRLSVLRSGTLQFAIDFLSVSPLQFFDADLVSGVQILKVWATFDPNINWTGVGDPILEMILTLPDGSNGLDLVRYDLDGSQPNGFYAAPFSGEFGPDFVTGASSNVPKAAGIITTPGSLQVQGSGAITPTAGTWEVFALIYTP